MGNPPYLAPPFTRENAREMQLKSAAAKALRRAREKEEERQRDIEARALALSREKHIKPEDARKQNVQAQIDATLDDLANCDDPELRVKLTAALDKLWTLVYPKMGASRPNKQPRRNQSEPQPIQTPQENLQQIKDSPQITPVRAMSQEM